MHLCKSTTSPASATATIATATIATATDSTPTCRRRLAFLEKVSEVLVGSPGQTRDAENSGGQCIVAPGGVVQRIGSPFQLFEIRLSPNSEPIRRTDKDQRDETNHDHGGEKADRLPSVEADQEPKPSDSDNGCSTNQAKVPADRLGGPSLSRCFC